MPFIRYQGNYVAQRINGTLQRSALSAALALCFASPVFAQSNTAGAVFGEASAGDTVLVENPATGFSRQVSVGSDGNFRAAALPVGSYTVTLTRADGTTSVRENVNVSVGTGTPVMFVTASGDATTLGTVQVIGTAVNPIDVSSTESTTVLTEEQIDRLPVPRNVTSVSLLAPGTTQGDGAFGNLASFGGASVAENVYYVNGFNVTNILKGTAFNQLPFEALAEQQIKTGGYGAEFGRSLGGVVNLITKRGTNEWHFGGNVFYTPGALRSIAQVQTEQGSTAYQIVDAEGERDELVYNVYGSGPLVKDRLFFYALVQGEDFEQDIHGLSQSTNTVHDAPQGVVKLDWQITNNHLLEVTAFRDKSEDVITTWDPAGPYSSDRTAENFLGTDTIETGGDNYVAKWTGYLTNNFTLSALYGKGEYSRSNVNSNSDCPVVADRRSGTTELLGCWVGQVLGAPDNGDEREAYRIDADWLLGDHNLRFGIDSETVTTRDASVYSGDVTYIYQAASPGDEVAPGVFVPAGATEVVSARTFRNGGTYETQLDAWYIEDNWDITDNFLAKIGVRNESFENLNALGGAFVSVDNTWAPRLGFSWDVNGDSSTKVYGSAGRYFIPVYANTNVRLAGSETDYTDWYTFDGIDPVTGAPVGATQFGDRVVVSDGVVPDPRAVVDNELDPLYQDEYILGVQQQVGDLWSVGVSYIWRELGSTVDDMCDGSQAYEWALENGYSDDQAGQIYNALSHCFLTNPGEDLSANIDLDGTGELTAITIPADAIGIPGPTRKYRALEFTVERAWDDKWFLKGSYTYAKNYGNTEGYVKSDNGQDDAGITQDFDFPGLMDGAYGYLPNDRRHQLKLFGSYQVADEWRVGGNLLVKSGRPQNCFGVYPADGPDQVAPLYGVASFYCGTANSSPTLELEDGSVVANPDYEPSYGTGDFHPRGTSGRTPWVTQLDLQVAYEPNWAEGLALRVDVVNVFNSQKWTEVNEDFETDSRGANAQYLHPTAFQPGRAVTFSVEYDW